MGKFAFVTLFIRGELFVACLPLCKPGAFVRRKHELMEFVVDPDQQENENAQWDSRLSMFPREASGIKFHRATELPTHANISSKRVYPAG